MPNAVFVGKPINTRTFPKKIILYKVARWPGYKRRLALVTSEDPSK